MLDAPPPIFVCGLGRCGTSLVMKMLSRGGIPALGTRPDFECEETSRLPGPAGAYWLWRHAPGHAVKLLDPHRWTPPAAMPAKVIWLDRDFGQQAASQLKLLRASGVAAPDSRAARRAMRATLLRDRRHAREALAGPHRDRLTLNFTDLVGSPSAVAAMLCRFLAPHYLLDPHRAAAAVIPRSPDCLPGMLETMLLVDARA